jgi:hypothetical protein
MGCMVLGFIVFGKICLLGATTRIMTVLKIMADEVLKFATNGAMTFRLFMSGQWLRDMTKMPHMVNAH